MEKITFWIAIIGCTVGVTSLILSIYNLRRSIRKDKVSITVLTKKYESPLGESGILIEVQNTGFVPATIEYIGFEMPNGGSVQSTQVNPLDKGSLPKRLEPHSSLQVHYPFDQKFFDAVDESICCFAKTSSGLKFTGQVSLNTTKKVIYANG